MPKRKERAPPPEAAPVPAAAVDGRATARTLNAKIAAGAVSYRHTVDAAAAAMLVGERNALDGLAEASAKLMKLGVEQAFLLKMQGVLDDAKAKVKSKAAAEAGLEVLYDVGLRPTAALTAMVDSGDASLGDVLTVLVKTVTENIRASVTSRAAACAAGADRWRRRLHRLRRQRPRRRQGRERRLRLQRPQLPGRVPHVQPHGPPGARLHERTATGAAAGATGGAGAQRRGRGRGSGGRRRRRLGLAEGACRGGGGTAST